MAKHLRLIPMLIVNLTLLRNDISDDNLTHRYILHVCLVSFRLSYVLRFVEEWNYLYFYEFEEYSVNFSFFGSTSSSTQQRLE